jgi:ketosteroid isomerase-like protein
VSTPADTAVRARRRLTNKLIAAKDAARLRPFFTDDVVVIVGDGGLVHGLDQLIAAFAAQFADPAFVAYVRTTERVEVDEGAGTWVGTWSGAAGEMGGTYLAAWRNVRGQWIIERELYVTLRG